MPGPSFPSYTLTAGAAPVRFKLAELDQNGQPVASPLPATWTSDNPAIVVAPVGGNPSVSCDVSAASPVTGAHVSAQIVGGGAPPPAVAIFNAALFPVSSATIIPE